MNEFWSDVIPEIKRDHIKQIQVHGVIGESYGWNFEYTAMLQIQLGNDEMMGKCISADRWNTCKDDNREKQNDQK